MDASLYRLSELIGTTTGAPFVVRDARMVGGGSISSAFTLVGDDGRQFFVKRQALQAKNWFEAESDGLEALRQCDRLHIPQPVGLMEDAQSCYLVLEYLSLGGPSDPAALGEAIAALHGLRGSAFGWRQDNFIGATPQPNPWTPDWIGFFAQQRLAYQRQLAARQGADRALLDAVHWLEDNLAVFFAGYQPSPALLHGDLWSGNWGYLANGTPTVFDPAVYYGDREADLAMMELFGHPGERFFAAYTAHLPLDPGYSARKLLYNLYHILNHYHLFGGGYAAQAQQMAQRLRSLVR